MSTIAQMTLYEFEREDGHKLNYCTTNPKQAKDYGQRYGLLVIANEFVWDDSEIAWDFREEEDGE